MEANLGGLLALVNEWLKFSEAKNAACIAFNAAVISVLIDRGSPENLLSVYLLVVLVAAFISTGISLVSFLPALSIDRNLMPATVISSSDSDSIIFFGSIAKMGYARFHERACLAFATEKESPLFSMLAQQIFVNSVIAVRKLKLFNAAVFVISAGVTCGLSILVWAIMKKNGDIG